MATPLALGAALLIASAAAARADPQEPPSAARPVVSDVRMTGVTVYDEDELQRHLGLAAGEPLPDALEAIAVAIRRRYERDGYTFAEVEARLDETTLAILVDEGSIDDVEFRGVSAETADRLRASFAVGPGEVFNRAQAHRALDQALAAAQGSIVRVSARDAFELVRENGRRVLRVNLRTRGSRSGLFIGTQGREDWYSPVDGFNPALGFQSTIFDSTRFNHAYWSGYVAYKFAADRFGYSFGLERPFLPDAVLQVGGAIHDLTASDDAWRLGDGEQSLVAFGFRNTFRDYYRRKGYQLHAAVRPWRGHEWLAAWRRESHVALANATDYGLFRDGHSFRPNAQAAEGALRAVLVGYTFDTRGLVNETPGDRFRRHLRDDLVGSPSPRDHGARVEWTSELAPAAFGRDFDFSRHILNVRAWRQTSPGRLVSGRVIGGIASGSPPPQRLLALGGIGTVHGYGFKQAVGERMLLLNGEVRQRFGRSGLGGLAFIDAGRVFRPVDGSTEEWLKGVGVGLELGSTARVEFGWRLDDIPRSLQVLFRLGPAF